jgi:hypothetical protein
VALFGNGSGEGVGKVVGSKVFADEDVELEISSPAVGVDVNVLISHPFGVIVEVFCEVGVEVFDVF